MTLETLEKANEINSKISSLRYLWKHSLLNIESQYEGDKFDQEILIELKNELEPDINRFFDEKIICLYEELERL